MKRRELITLLGSTAAIWPLTAYPQSARKIPLVGYLWHAASAGEEQPYYGAMLDGFTQLGYVEGRTIELVHRFPNEKPELFKSMANELVALNPDVLMGGSISSPVRYSPESRHSSTRLKCPLCAKNRHSAARRKASLFNHLVGASAKRRPPGGFRLIRSAQVHGA